MNSPHQTKLVLVKTRVPGLSDLLGVKAVALKLHFKKHPPLPTTSCSVPVVP